MIVKLDIGFVAAITKGCIPAMLGSRFVVPQPQRHLYIRIMSIKIDVLGSKEREHAVMNHTKAGLSRTALFTM